MATTGQLVVYGKGALISNRGLFCIEDDIKRWKKGRREKVEYRMPAYPKKSQMTIVNSPLLQDSTQNYENAKQVVVKSIWHNKISDRTKVEKAFSYLSQKTQNKTEFDYFSQESKAFCLVGEHGQYLSQQEFRTLGQHWDMKNEELEGRVACHLVFSIEEKPTPNNCHIVESAIRRIQNYYADLGFDCAFAVHQDTEHAHAHLMIRAKNNQNHKKLRLGQADLFFLRQEFAKGLQQQGLNYCATKSNNPEYHHYLQQKQDKNYLLSVAKRDYGDKAEKLIKKSFIEQHDEGKAGQQAKQNLQHFRACLRGDKQAQAKFEKSFADYSRLLEKYELKQKLKVYFAQLNEARHVEMAVDYAFALEAKALQKARSEDVPSLTKLQHAKDFKESLLAIAKNPSLELESVAKAISISKSIADFGNRQDQNKQLAQDIKKPNPYGEYGLVYMQFFQRLYAKTHDQEKRKTYKQNIDNAQQGNIPQEHVDHLVFSLLKEEKQKDQFLAERKIFYQQKLAQATGVTTEQVVLLDTIFDQYFLKQNQNKHQAAKQFFDTMQNYEKALADPQKLKRLTYAILQKNHQSTMQL